ncbi:uncharacterized protein LOC122537930 [Frieseomelitta varia]|uniref:uncharacterized protein LOC122537930 n=1 Tax=Frieseomelitta varia TaxID=561572 RepID=UPI001CB6AC50|nr:uncharacterized protein LOC122537930 [Frieseomelitta varia]
MEGSRGHQSQMIHRRNDLRNCMFVWFLLLRNRLNVPMHTPKIVRAREMNSKSIEPRKSCVLAVCLVFVLLFSISSSFFNYFVCSDCEVCGDIIYFKFQVSLIIIDELRFHRICRSFFI